MPQRKNPDVVNAIFKATNDPQIQTSMVFGAGLESGWNDTAQNPSSATGPFQILLTAHPGVTTLQAEDTTFATDYMLGSYKSAVAQVSSDLWSSNPELAAEQTVNIAEQPGGQFPVSSVVPYGSESTDVVNQRWTQTQQIMSGQGVTPAILTSSTSSTSVPSANVASEAGDFARMGLALTTGNPTAFFNALGDALWNTEMIKIGLILFGAIMFLIGIRKLGVHPVKATEKVAGAATTAVGAVTGQPEVMAAGRSIRRQGTVKTVRSQVRKRAQASGIKRGRGGAESDRETSKS